MTMTFLHDHVGISVTPDDLDATVRWYADHLGFVLDQRFEAHGTTFAFLANGPVRIELLAGASRRHPAPAGDVLESLDPERLHHFCLAVEDLDAAVAGLRERGVELIGGPMEVPAIGRRIAFVTDNVGTVIELAESGPPTSGARG
ncbi:VOC family protein [Nonomuraea sp. MG754425]|uniref:VOC family protein n=1 Tax=Nonomuraea sp. MG754425 TaxID=2570319 RepID=UPI001F1A4023|nr:VOC family protein [Nonomuraea sp. MG754425]